MFPSLSFRMFEEFSRYFSLAAALFAPLKLSGLCLLSERFRPRLAHYINTFGFHFNYYVILFAL
jgi:hypothetical protein